MECSVVDLGEVPWVPWNPPFHKNLTCTGCSRLSPVITREIRTLVCSVHMRVYKGKIGLRSTLQKCSTRRECYTPLAPQPFTSYGFSLAQDRVELPF